MWRKSIGIPNRWGVGQWEQRRELEDALGTNEVGLKRRALCVTAPSDAGHIGTGFREQRIIDQDHDGIGNRELLHARRANAG